VFSKKCNFNYGNTKKKSAETFVKDIRNNTRRIFTAEQKILIVMEAFVWCHKIDDHIAKYIPNTYKETRKITP